MYCLLKRAKHKAFQPLDGSESADLPRLGASPIRCGYMCLIFSLFHFSLLLISVITLWLSVCFPWRIPLSFSLSHTQLPSVFHCQSFTLTL